MIGGRVGGPLGLGALPARLGLAPRPSARSIAAPLLSVGGGVACPRRLRPPPPEAGGDQRTSKRAVRDRLHRRIRKKVNGTPERPRLCVHRSNQYLTCQVIDDEAQTTLVHVTTMQRELKFELAPGSLKNMEAAVAVGLRVAWACQEKGIEKLCFDRSGYLYHGRVKLIADTVRQQGIKM